MLSVSGISKRYGGQIVLADVTWGADAGDDVVFFNDDATEPLPNMDLEFGEITTTTTTVTDPETGITTTTVTDLLTGETTVTTTVPTGGV